MTTMLRRLALIAALVLAFMPAARAAASGPDRYAELDGFLVHYQSVGKGSPVILIHGFTMTLASWAGQTTDLARTHQVVTLDLPGHGDSGAPRDTVYDPDLYARAVEAVAKDAGISHAALVGHSMGLPIIHTVLRRGKLSVDKAVFIDGAILAPPADAAQAAARKAWMDGMIAGLHGPDYQLVLEQLITGLSPKLAADPRKRLIAQARAMDRNVAATTFEHLADAAVWAPARFELPVLALYAGPLKPGVAEWLAATYPKSKLVAWDDVDHFIHLEQPKRVADALVKFLK